MKKLLVAAVAGVLLTLASCSSSSSLLGGSWTFKGTTYSAYTAIGSTTAKTLTASTVVRDSSTQANNVIFRFATYPPAAGTYTIVGSASAGSLTASQVYVVQNIGLTPYTIDVSGSATCTVTLNGSKVNVTVPSVNFSTLQSSDSGPFTAAITQNL